MHIYTYVQVSIRIHTCVCKLTNTLIVVTCCFRSLLILAEYSRLCVQVVSAVCLLAEADNDKCSLV